MIGQRHRQAIAADAHVSTPFTDGGHFATPWTSIAMEERQYVGH